MSSDALLIYTYSATAATFVYPALNGGIIKNALIPAFGYALSKVGRCWKSRCINEIGNSIILTCVISIPGSIAGHTVVCQLGETLASKFVGYTVGLGLTYKIFNEVIKFACSSATGEMFLMSLKSKKLCARKISHS